MITISIPTPLVVFGEYLETYNLPSISVPINNLINYNFATISTSEIKINHYQKIIYQISKKIEKYLREISPKGLEISFEKDKADPITFTIAGVEAISKIYKLKLNKEQIYDACLTILSKVEINSKNLKAELCAGIWEDICYLDGQNLIPQTIKSKNIPIQIFKLNENNKSEYFNKLNNKLKKYPEDMQTIFDKIKYITNSAKIGLINSDSNLLADNLNKSQKILDNLKLCDKNLHKLLISAILSGALGLKYCTFNNNQYLLTIIPEENLDKVKKSLLKLSISETF